MISESDKETIFEGLSFVFGVFLYALCLIITEQSGKEKEQES